MTDRNLVGLFKDLKGQEWIVSHTDLKKKILTEKVDLDDSR